jgi:hypothetical protein
LLQGTRDLVVEISPDAEVGKPLSDLRAITDRVEIEALRGEFTDALMMRDYNGFASLFTQDGAVRIPAHTRDVLAAVQNGSRPMNPSSLVCGSASSGTSTLAP